MYNKSKLLCSIINNSERVWVLSLLAKCNECEGTCSWALDFLDCSQIAGAASVSTYIVDIYRYRGGHFQSHSAVEFNASFRDDLCFSLAVCQKEWIDLKMEETLSLIHDFPVKCCPALTEYPFIFKWRKRCTLREVKAKMSGLLKSDEFALFILCVLNAWQQLTVLNSRHKCVSIKAVSLLL